MGRPGAFRSNLLRGPQPIRPIPLTPLGLRHLPASSQRFGGVEIRRGRGLKIDRLYRAVSNGSLRDIADIY